MTTLGWTLLLAWLAQALFATWATHLFLRLRARPRPQPEGWQPICVLVPLRGAPGDFLAALAAQDYPAWHVVFALEDAGDPGFAPTAAFCAADPARRALVLAGATTRRAQKLHNLLAALPRLRSADAVLVTLDADTRPPPDTLRRLVRPLLAGGADLASGYRWLQAGPRLGGRLAALADNAIATLPRHDALSLLWGGATAIRADALSRLDLPALWDQAISDDLTLSQAARASGMVVHAPYDVRLPSPVDLSLTEAFGFARRQFQLVWLLARRFWWLALAGYLLPPLGLVASLSLAGTGHPEAVGATIFALALLACRLALRAQVQGPVTAPWLAPLAGAFALLALLAAPGRRLRWAHRYYQLGQHGQVLTVLSFDAARTDVPL